MTSDSTRLVCENLACERGGRLVFSGINFAVTAGEAMIVTGRNGAGKSTLLRVIAGLLRAAGRVELSGDDDGADVAERAHYLGHLDAIKPSLTVAENLQFWARFLGAPADASIEPALEAVELASLADLPAAYLSAGQKRRLSIARLLAVKRPLWLLDEPTSALDTQSQARLASFMRDHLAGGGMIVAATHGPVGLGSPRELKMGAAG